MSPAESYLPKLQKLPARLARTTSHIIRNEKNKKDKEGHEIPHQQSGRVIAYGIEGYQYVCWQRQECNGDIPFLDQCPLLP
jgi:hypothetical protein